MDPRIIRPVREEYDWSTSSPSRFILRDRTPGSGGSGASLDVTALSSRMAIFFLDCLPLTLEGNVLRSF
jgi:hypothetical protein